MQLFFSLINRLYSLRACTYASLFSSLMVPFFSGVSFVNAFSRCFAFVFASLQSLSNQRASLTSEFTPQHAHAFSCKRPPSVDKKQICLTQNLRLHEFFDCGLTGQRWQKLMQFITVPNNLFSPLKISRFVHIVTWTLICTCIYWKW